MSKELNWQEEFQLINVEGKKEVQHRPEGLIIMGTVGKILPRRLKLVGRVGRKKEYSNNREVSAPKYLLIIQGNIVQLQSGEKPSSTSNTTC